MKLNVEVIARRPRPAQRGRPGRADHSACLAKELGVQAARCTGI